MLTNTVGIVLTVLDFVGSTGRYRLIYLFDTTCVYYLIINHHYLLLNTSVYFLYVLNSWVKRFTFNQSFDTWDVLRQSYCKTFSVLSTPQVLLPPFTSLSTLRPSQNPVVLIKHTVTLPPCTILRKQFWVS